VAFGRTARQRCIASRQDRERGHRIEPRRHACAQASTRCRRRDPTHTSNIEHKELHVATKVNIRIYNYTAHSITTEVTDEHDLEDGGSEFNGKTIAPDSALEGTTTVGTGTGNGELTILIKEGTRTIGYFKMKDLKNPHEGLDSLEVPTPPEHPYQFTYVAYRNLPTMPEDDRYTYLVVNTFPQGSTLP
jgi:hypothetical protein